MSRHAVRMVTRLCRSAHGAQLASSGGSGLLCLGAGGLSRLSVSSGALSFPASVSASGRCGASLTGLSAAALSVFSTDICGTLVDDT